MYLSFGTRTPANPGFTRHPVSAARNTVQQRSACVFVRAEEPTLRAQYRVVSPETPIPDKVIRSCPHVVMDVVIEVVMDVGMSIPIEHFTGKTTPPVCHSGLAL